MSDSYLTIEKPSEGIYKEKGSKFLSFAFPVRSEEEVKEVVATLKKTYYDARHHCYAYVLGYKQEKYRENDDGEPSGTAGKPIHGQILSNKLTQVLIVVVRYFGGTKLGVSGLIQAYKAAAKDAIDKAVIVEKIVKDEYLLRFPYEQMNAVMKIIKDEQLEQLSHAYEVICEIKISVRQADSERIRQLFEEIAAVTALS